jgi:hypothetical protein
MDIEKISLWVAVLAVLLAVPLTIVGNLLTPAFQSWYSTTNQKRLRRRLDALQLLLSEPSWTFTPAEWESYRANCRLLFAIAAGVAGVNYLLLGFMEVVRLLYEKSVGVVQHQPVSKLAPSVIPALILIFLSGFGFTAMVILLGLQMVEFRMNRDLHTEEGREAMRKEIVRLAGLEMLKDGAA